MKQEHKHISKFLSLVLRHQPELIGLKLNEGGWVNVEELISKMNREKPILNREVLETIVASNEKKRFAFNNEKTMIRANQGHSIDVQLNLQPVEPPVTLYHGTAVQFVEGIREKGLLKQKRQHVHLSATKETAVQVGSRHGKVVVLEVDAQAMYHDGYQFYLSANNVWLTDHVPVKYIVQP